MSTNIKKECPSIAFVGLKLAILRYMPFCSNAYDNILKLLIANVSNKSFQEYSLYLTGMVKLSKKRSLEYYNSNREVDGLLKEYPRLNKGMLLPFVQMHRKKYKLKV